MRMQPLTSTLSVVACWLDPQSVRLSPSAWVPHFTSTSEVDRSPSSGGMKCPTNQPRTASSSRAALPVINRVRSEPSLSDDPLIAPIEWHLCGRRPRKHGSAHFGHHLGHV